MENGFFQNLSENSTDTLALNSQEKLDLSIIPQDILHSCTVEALIEQNEDLMARLKIGIRRISLLEQTLQKSESEYSVLRGQISSLSDQLLIWKEKEKAWQQKHSCTEEDFNKIKVENELTQIRYAELYSTFQEKKSYWEKTLQKLQGTLSLHYRYHRRVNTWGRNYINRLKSNLQVTQNHVHQLNEQSEQKQNLIAELRKNIENLVQHTKELNGQILENQKNITTLENEKIELGKEITRKEYLKEENENLKNQVILLKRSLDEYKNKAQQEFQEIQDKMSFYRSDAKKLTLNSEQMQGQLDEASTTIKLLREERDKLSSQLESLQILWTDKQLECERLQNHNESLEKINHELSDKFNFQRKALESQLEC